MDKKELTALLALAELAGKKAGDFILKNRPRDINFKSSEHDLVTECDKAVETIIRGVLESSGISILGEEFGGQTDLTQSWVIDPIDGTYNFVKGSSLVGSNIALIIEEEPVLALTNLPYLNEIYTSIRGSGVFFNGAKLPKFDSEPPQRPLNIGLSTNRSTTRLLGAASVELAWFARTIFSEVKYDKVAPWDVAPGILFTKELGGFITSTGSPYWDDAHFSSFMGSNG